MPNFPVLDGDRTNTVGRVVLSELGELEPLVDEMDRWVSLPVRVALTAAAGIVLELGPYTLDDSDVAALAEVIRRYHETSGGGG